MITDWVLDDEEDLRAYLKHLKVTMHPKIRQGKASCWFHYSKTADMYMGSIKFRDMPSGKNIVGIAPRKTKAEIAIDAIYEISLHYGHQRRKESSF